MFLAVQRIMKPLSSLHKTFSQYPQSFYLRLEHLNSGY